MRPDTKGWAGGSRARFTVVGTNICPALHKTYGLHQEVREQLTPVNGQETRTLVCSDTRYVAMDLERQTRASCQVLFAG